VLPAPTSAFERATPTPGPGRPWLGLDIGGANLKAARADGSARVVPFELWKQPKELPRRLAALVAAMKMGGRRDRLAVTMTAELCDCYPTRAFGVRAVLDAVASIVDDPSRDVIVWGVDGAFHDPTVAREGPERVAASNWLAVATLAARLQPEGPGILIDIGTTTTDLIPLSDGRAAPIGRTDTARLRTGEMVYAGVVRTPLCALATELNWRDAPTGLAAELFASTLDVYLTLGDMAEDPNNDSTADGRPRTRAAARDRLARMVGADRDTFSEDDAVELARAADATLTARLVEAGRRATRGLGAPPRHAIISGTGDFLARRVASALIGPDITTIHDLRSAWGPAASDAACAYAVAVLASERHP
jgi:probable H4MPT-linked C1 transfer pathway protein